MIKTIKNSSKKRQVAKTPWPDTPNRSYGDFERMYVHGTLSSTDLLTNRLGTLSGSMSSGTGKSIENYFDMFQQGQKKYAILGISGIGKSTLCKKIMYDWAVGNADKFDCLFMVKSESVTVDVLQYIMDDLRDNGLGPEECSDEQLQRVVTLLLDKDSTLLIFDAVDEADDDVDDEIMNIVNGNKYCCTVLVTSKAQFGGLRSQFQNHKYQLEFTQDDVKEYIQKYYCFNPKRIQQQSSQLPVSERLWKVIQANNLWQVVATPLNCSLICSLCAEKEEFIDNLEDHITNLYQEILDVIHTKCFSNTEMTKWDDMMDRLGEFAFGLMTNNRSKGTSMLTDVEWTSLCDTGLVNRRGRGAHFYFVLTSMKEYLAARYLHHLNGPKSDQIKAALFSTKKRSVLGSNFLYKFLFEMGLSQMSDGSTETAGYQAMILMSKYLCEEYRKVLYDDELTDVKAAIVQSSKMQFRWWKEMKQQTRKTSTDFVNLIYCTDEQIEEFGEYIDCVLQSQESNIQYLQTYFQSTKNKFTWKQRILDIIKKSHNLKVLKTFNVALTGICEGVNKEIEFINCTNGDLNSDDMQFFHQCKELRKLKIAGNHLDCLDRPSSTGSKWEHLKKLDLTDTVIQDGRGLLEAVPDGIELLLLSGCGLNTEFLQLMAQKMKFWRNLKYLSLKENDLNKFSVDMVNSLPQTMLGLNFSWCGLDKNTLKALSHKLTTMTSLQEIYLSGNYLGGVEFDFVRGIKSPEIEMVALDNCGLHIDNIVGVIQSWKQLRYLLFQENIVSKHGVMNLESTFDWVEAVALNNCGADLTEYTRSPCDQTKKYSKLKYLILNENNMGKFCEYLSSKIDVPIQLISFYNCGLTKENFVGLAENMSKWKNLNFLHLGENRPSDVGSQLIEVIPESLQNLSLENCMEKSSTMEALGQQILKLKKLKTLVLTAAKLKVNSSVIQNLPSGMLSITLSKCQMDLNNLECLVNKLPDMKSLAVLKLEGTDLADMSVDVIDSLPSSLNTLNINNCNIGSDAVEALIGIIPQLPGLVDLRINRNNLGRVAIFRLLPETFGINILECGDGNEGKEKSSEVSQLIEFDDVGGEAGVSYKWDHLMQLNLDGVVLSDMGSNLLSGIPSSLEELSLGNCLLSPGDFKTLTESMVNWKKLKKFNLEGNTVTNLEEIVQAIPSTIEEINFSKCDLTPNNVTNFAEHILTWKKLRKFGLVGNKLEDLMQKIFQALPLLLEELNVSECSLKQESLKVLSTCVKRMKCLKTLDVSCNTFSSRDVASEKDKGVALIKAIPENIQILNLSSTELSNGSMKRLTRCVNQWPKLKELSLDNISLDGVFQELVKNIPSGIQKLSLNQCQLTEGDKTALNQQASRLNKLLNQ